MVRPDVALRVRGGIMSEGLAIHMEEVAKILMGDPVPGHSKPGKPRYGNNGSVAIDVSKGAFYDHENQEGGGVLDLIERMTGNKGRDAIAWMSEQGIRVDDPDTPSRHRDGQGRANGHTERREEPRAEKAAPEPSQKADKPKREIKATYDYHATDGTLLYQVVRFEPKGFAQRRPDPRSPGKWIWNLEGIEHTLYRLPDIFESLGMGVVTVLVEGEKDADTLTAWGVPATTNSGGAKHWSERHAEHFRGSDVVIVPDNDDAGRAGAEIKAKSLAGIAKRVRILDLAKVVEGFPHKGDVTDWRDQCGAMSMPCTI
jgi:putative DNA primase/helicase